MAIAGTDSGWVEDSRQGRDRAVNRQARMMEPHGPAELKPDQAAIISQTNHLSLHIRGALIDCGSPRSTPDDAQANAAIFHWYRPDTLG
jgi:hypothetical protein